MFTDTCVITHFYGLFFGSNNMRKFAHKNQPRITTHKTHEILISQTNQSMLKHKYLYTNVLALPCFLPHCLPNHHLQQNLETVWMYVSAGQRCLVPPMCYRQQNLQQANPSGIEKSKLVGQLASPQKILYVCIESRLQCQKYTKKNTNCACRNTSKNKAVDRVPNHNTATVSTTLITNHQQSVLVGVLHCCSYAALSESGHIWR